MPEYKSIDNSTPEGRRTARNLITLKFELDNAIPARTVDSTLLLASWNIREFGGTKSGGREAEPLYYIAEIMSHFYMWQASKPGGSNSRSVPNMPIMGWIKPTTRSASKNRGTWCGC